MSINKIIVIIGVLFAIFIAFIFLQFNPLSKSPNATNASTVTINEQTFRVTVSETEEEKQKGLSEVNSLPQDEGELFLFEKADILSFWMKDMKFAIDIIFINGDTVVSIVENAKPPTKAVVNPTCATLQCYSAEKPADKVLEINAGLSKKYNIKPGDKVDIQF